MCACVPCPSNRKKVRALLEKDFAYAVQSIRPSVSPESLSAYSKWAEQYGVNR